ncbi:MAG: hypothetical protein K2I00_03955 [Ruminococcus sp.]|nr:hypothetical protein [Ruminococcus sp.]
MKEYLTALKDILVVLSPIVVAYISYRSGKKTKKDIQRELEKNLKEKDAETFHIIQKINTELESQKQISSWNNSLPKTEEYIGLAGVERYGNITSITQLVLNLNEYISNNNLSLEELQEIKILLSRINLPLEEENLYTYEIPYIISYNRLIRQVDKLIQNYSNT